MSLHIGLYVATVVLVAIQVISLVSIGRQVDRLTRGHWRTYIQKDIRTLMRLAYGLVVIATLWLAIPHIRIVW